MNPKLDMRNPAALARSFSRSCARTPRNRSTSAIGLRISAGASSSARPSSSSSASSLFLSDADADAEADPALDPGLQLAAGTLFWRPTNAEYAMMAALNPDFGPAGPPPLPPISSRQLLRQALTHRSYHGRPAHVFEDAPNDPAPDNEMLEHLGDTVLNLIVTCLLKEMCPRLRVGPCTKIRALVVGNTTLASLTLLYRLNDRLRFHPAQAITLRASPNIQADAFESYVGALYHDQGLAAVDRWLRQLLTPYIAEAYAIVRAQHGLPPSDAPLTACPSPPPPVSATAGTLSIDTQAAMLLGETGLATPPLADGDEFMVEMRAPSRAGGASESGYLPLFNQQLSKDHRDVEWHFATCTDAAVSDAKEGSKATPIWTVRAMVAGDCLGSGKGRTKKAAKNEAARQALESMGVLD